MSEITIAAFNMLLDKRFPQENRLPGQLQVLEQLHREQSLDVLGLLEVGGTNGELVSNSLFGNPGFWTPHSRSKLKEHIGVAGHAVQQSAEVDLGHKKSAVIAYTEDVAVAFVHLKRMHKHFPEQPEQSEQMAALLDVISGEPRAAIAGDFNCLHFQKPRRMLYEAGFRSAFKLAGVARPTFPLPGYDIFTTPTKARLAKLVGGISLDDIYVRGVEVLDAGSLEAHSDHPIVRARIR